MAATLQAQVTEGEDQEGHAVLGVECSNQIAACVRAQSIAIPHLSVVLPGI